MQRTCWRPSSSRRPPGSAVGDAAIDALMVLSVNGDMIGARPGLAGRDGRDGAAASSTPAATGRALAAAAGGRPLRLGVPFPLSMHAALVDYWLREAGLAGGVDLVTVPPPRMAAAMAGGEIDAFCVGEPWGSVAVETGAAQLILPGAAIWQLRAGEGAGDVARDGRGRAGPGGGADARRSGGRRAGSAIRRTR